MQTVTYPEKIKTSGSNRKFSTKKSTSSAKIETLRRKTIRQDKYRPLG